METEKRMMRPLPAIAGPTGVGKTEVGVRVAQALGAEILSVDSRQIYRHMDIGTAKPSAEEQRMARHHLIDIVDPDSRFSAGAFGRIACQTLSELEARNVPALLVGGAGLYFKALTGELFEAPDIPDDIRQTIRRRLENLDSAQLFETLGRVDPVASARIHPNDRQRITRALEVYEATGRPLSAWHKTPSDHVARPVIWIGLDRDRSALYRRIDARVDRMMREGLVEEVEGLIRMGYDSGAWALRTFGYAEILDFLEGEMTISTAVERIKQETRRYAKRQWTWFRRQETMTWVEIGDEDAPEHVGETIVDLLSDQGVTA
jgi:tRNA dimethylallyltransferase